MHRLALLGRKGFEGARKTHYVSDHSSMSGAQPQVIIIAGPNGSGKTTLAPFLLRDTFGLLEFVNADTISAGLSAFNPEAVAFDRSEEHTSELQSQSNLVCRLLLEKKNKCTWTMQPILLSGIDSV